MSDGGYAKSIEMHSRLTKKQLVELCVNRLKEINDLRHELRILKANEAKDTVGSSNP